MYTSHLYEIIHLLSKTIMKLIAYTVKGIEHIAEIEIKRLFKTPTIERVEEKAILFEIPDSELQTATKLTTVDDINMFIEEIPLDNSLTHRTLAQKIVDINYGKTKRLLDGFREGIKGKKFSLTVSLPALPNLQTIPFKNLLAQELAKAKEWTYTEKDHTNFDIRIFKAEKTLLVGCRLTKESLHERPYKQQYLRGSLRPTIAAALVELAMNGNKPGKLADSFCGSGTILAEAYLKGNDIWGGDIDGGAVNVTKSNLKNLDVQKLDQIGIRNAEQPNLPEKFFDYIVSNLPWGKQIEADSFSDLFMNALKEYKRIIKPNGSIVLLSKKPEMILSAAERIFHEAEISSFTISLVGQQPTVVVIRLKS